MLTKNKVELPAQVEYWMKQIESTSNKSTKYEYYVKIKELRDHLDKTLNKYKLEFANEK